jgi:hypothetical protein
VRTATDDLLLRSPPDKCRLHFITRADIYISDLNPNTLSNPRTHTRTRTRTYTRIHAESNISAVMSPRRSPLVKSTSTPLSRYMTPALGPVPTIGTASKNESGQCLVLSVILPRSLGHLLFSISIAYPFLCLTKDAISHLFLLFSNYCILQFT